MPDESSIENPLGMKASIENPLPVRTPEKVGFIVLQHTWDTVRDAWFEGGVLVIRQITVSPEGGQAGIKFFRLTQAEWVKIADLIGTLTRTRAQVAVAGAESQ